MNNVQTLALNITNLTPWTIDTSQYTDPDTLMAGKVTTWINFFIAFAAVVAVIMIVVAGYKFITAAGDPDKIEGGKKMITAAVVGLIIVFVAALIVKYILGVISPEVMMAPR